MSVRIRGALTPKLGWGSVFLLMGLFLTYCGGGSGGGDDTVTPTAPPANSERVIDTDVTAAAGGTFSDDPAQPAFSITIPPGGILADSRLVVDKLLSPQEVGTFQTAASEAFQVSLTGFGRVLADIVITMAADPAPVHPQLGEIAQFDGNNWLGLDANFFRPSENTVVGLTRLTQATFRVVHRSRRLATGMGVDEGFDVFLNATFGNENFFGPVIGLHTLLNNVTPNQVVPLGVQVDITKVPAGIVTTLNGTDLAAKDAALDSAVTTQQLIKAGAVIGVKGVYADPADPNDITMTSAGITCALCHLNVTPTQFDLTAGLIMLPIGPPEIDGIPNTQMDAGAILALTPFGQDPLNAAIAAELNSWGPGAFDIRALSVNGDNPLDDGVNNPTSNPPLWNFIDLLDLGYRLGWDGLFQNNGINNNALASQAEAVYDLVMHANGAFGTPGGIFPPELSIAPPQALLAALAQAEADQPGNDLDVRRILDLQTWMRSLPSPPPATFDEAQAEAGFLLFYGQANCVSCHFNREIQGQGTFFNVQPPLGELATTGIRVPSLRGASRTAPYFHNQAAATLEDAVAHFVTSGLVPPLTPAEQARLVAYLKSL